MAISIDSIRRKAYGEDIDLPKVTEKEKEGVPHFLFDIKTPLEDYSVSDYQKDARKIT